MIVLRLLLLLLILPIGRSFGQRSLSLSEVRAELFGDHSLAPLAPALPSPSPSGEQKSVGIAILASLALPGMGELYSGSFSSGKYFLGAEGVLWLTYAVFQVYGDALRDDARAYAVAHAGISLSGKNDQFFVDLGNFANVDDYNQKRLRDRQVERLYDPALGFGWSWDSETSRLSYRDQRIASDNIYNDRKFVLAAILVNHVASAINAARSAIAHNKETAALGDLQFSARLLGTPGQVHGVELTLTKFF
jgi:hypothetical protein